MPAIQVVSLIERSSRASTVQSGDVPISPSANFSISQLTSAQRGVRPVHDAPDICVLHGWAVKLNNDGCFNVLTCFNDLGGEVVRRQAHGSEDENATARHQVPEQVLKEEMNQCG